MFFPSSSVVFFRVRLRRHHVGRQQALLCFANMHGTGSAVAHYLVPVPNVGERYTSSGRSALTRSATSR